MTTENEQRQTPKIGKIGVCAMDAKVRSKPMRHILGRLIQNGDFETIIFGDKVILDESIENWPTCDFLISFFSRGFPLEKAISYVNLRKPFIINDLVMQKILWDRRLVLNLLEANNVPTPHRLEISRDGGPRCDEVMKTKLLEHGVKVEKINEPKWEMLDNDTLCVEGQILKKPFVEKPVDGEDHNVYIYYHTENGGGGRRLFRKVGNKSSEFDPTISMPRTNGSYIYEKFMNTDNFEDVKAYTVGPNFCHAETRKSPVVDGIVRRNTHGKEVRYVTLLTDKEKQIAQNVSKAFSQTICGFDLLRVNSKSYVIDVNGFSFVKDNQDYYDNCANILSNLFKTEKLKREIHNKFESTFIKKPIIKKEEKLQKWIFKGQVNIVRHADRTPKQKFKFSFKSSLFINLLNGHLEEVIIRNKNDLKVILSTVKLAQLKKIEDDEKLLQLRSALEKKMNFPGTKVQLKPVLKINSDTMKKEVEKVQLIIKWGGEPTHSAMYQATDLGTQMRQDLLLLNKAGLDDVKVFTSSERRVVASAKLWAAGFLDKSEVPDDFLHIRKDLLDDSNAAKDLMDKVKKKLKPLLREGTEAPSQFAWPPKMPEPYFVIKRVVEIMIFLQKVVEHNFKVKDVENLQPKWCCDEDSSLFKERWDKLFKEFSCLEKFDPSKISELYDTMKHDALHNRRFLAGIFETDKTLFGEEEIELDRRCSDGLMNYYPINLLAVNNFRISEMVKNNLSSSGTTESSAGSLGWVLNNSSRLKHHPVTGQVNSNSPFDSPNLRKLRELYRLAKVLFDFVCPQEYGIEDAEKLDIGLLTSLPLAKQILQDIQYMKERETASTIMYFTKESHIYTLLNVIYESRIPTKIARNALPELDYLSQIVFELYESTDPVTEVKNHSIRLSFSPGCHTQDPLDIQLDARHYISCIPKFSLTSHLDMFVIAQRLRSRFSRVSMPKIFIPVSISSPLNIPNVNNGKITFRENIDYKKKVEDAKEDAKEDKEKEEENNEK